MSERIEDILDGCIDRIVREGDTVEECLARYPDRTEELEPALRAAAVALEDFQAEPPAEFQRAAKSRFMNSLAAMREEQGRRGWWLSGWQRGWALAAVLVLVVLIMGAGTVGASTNSLPGDVLYPVKRAAENVQAFFTFSSEARASLYMKFAERRVAEIEVLAAERGEVPAAVLGGMDNHTSRALDLASENGSFRPEVIVRLVKLTGSERSVLRRIAENAPALVQLRLREALKRSEIAHQRALAIKDSMLAPGNPQKVPGNGNQPQSEEPSGGEGPAPAESAAPDVDAGVQDQVTPSIESAGLEAAPDPHDEPGVGAIEDEDSKGDETQQPGAEVAPSETGGRFYHESVEQPSRTIWHSELRQSDEAVGITPWRL